MARAKKTDMDKILEEDETTKEILTDLDKATGEQLTYANNSHKMFEEENEAFFYISLVFQNNACAEEFAQKFGEFMGLKDENQIFVNGHELAKKWGKPLETSYVKKTVSIDKARDANSISEVGIYGK